MLFLVVTHCIYQLVILKSLTDNLSTDEDRLSFFPRCFFSKKNLAPTKRFSKDRFSFRTISPPLTPWIKLIRSHGERAQTHKEATVASQLLTPLFPHSQLPNPTQKYYPEKKNPHKIKRLPTKFKRIPA